MSVKPRLRLMVSRQDRSGVIYAAVWDSSTFHYPTGPAEKFREVVIGKALDRNTNIYEMPSWHESGGWT